MSRITQYGLLAVVGVGFSTVASVQAGDPLPVVAPGITAGVVIAVNHVREHRRSRARDDQQATDADVEQAVDDVEPDHDPRGERPDRRGHPDDRRDDQRGAMAEFDDTPDDQGGDPLGMFDDDERARRSA